MAARRPFWRWCRWKSIGFCLWPPSTCIWNLKLKFQKKLDLCSGNHAVYRQTDGRTDGQTDGRTDKVNPVYPPSNFAGRGYKYKHFLTQNAFENFIYKMLAILKRYCHTVTDWMNRWDMTKWHVIMGHDMSDSMSKWDMTQWQVWQHGTWLNDMSDSMS